MVLVFFITYVVFQPLATALIRRIGPRIFLSTIVMSWGACLIVRPPVRGADACSLNTNFARASPTLLTGRHCRVSVLYLVSSRRDSSLEPCISSPAGTRDVSFVLSRVVIDY
jgi:MFS family permease